MKNFKIGLIKLIILIGSKTFLGRGYCRKILISLVDTILKTINYDISKPLFISNFHEFQIYFYADLQTGLKLYFQRNENKELNFLKKKIKYNSWFIDIGSNIGLYTLNLANLISKKNKIQILSIEPNPLIFKRLRNNLSLLKKRNKFIKNNVFLEKVAIGDKKKEGYINTKINHENVKILNKKDFSANKNYRKIKITKIKNLIKKYKITNIYCIKIDTEGYEFIILKSFFKDFKYKHYPKILIIEHNNDPNYSKIDKLIINKGYKVSFTTNSNAIYIIKNENS